MSYEGRQKKIKNGFALQTPKHEISSNSGMKDDFDEVTYLQTFTYFKG